MQGATQQLQLEDEAGGTAEPGTPIVAFTARGRAGDDREIAVLRKAVQAVHCFPANGEMTGLMRRLFNALCVYVQEACRLMDADQLDLVWNHNCSPVFEITVRRLRSLVQVESKDYERVYEALKQLQGLKFVFNVMGDSGKGTVEKIGQGYTYFIHTLVLGEGSMRGRVQFQMPPVALRMVVEPYPYASIDMRIDNALGTGSAIGLYENCVRYWGTRSRMTAVMPVETWMALIVGGASYKGRYKDFRRYALQPAIKRLAALDGVPFIPHPREIKGAHGRVLELQFQLVPKESAQDDQAMPIGWGPDVISELSKSWAMSQEDIANLARMASLDEVKAALVRGRAMLARKASGGQAIASKPDYFRGIVTNLKGERAEEPASARQPMLQAERDAQAHMAALREHFSNWQSDLVQERLDAMPRENLARLQEMFTQANASNPAVQTMLQRGWGNRRAAIWRLLGNWLINDRLDLQPLVLYRAEETTFEVWHQSQSGGHSPAV